MHLLYLGYDIDSSDNSFRTRLWRGWHGTLANCRAAWERWITPRTPPNLLSAPLFMQDWLILIYLNANLGGRMQPLGAWKVGDNRVWRRSPILPWRKYPYIDVGFPAAGSNYYVVYNSPRLNGVGPEATKELTGVEIADLLVQNLEEASQPEPWFKPAGTFVGAGARRDSRRLQPPETERLLYRGFNPVRTGEQLDQ